jgi:hypothetical protein
MYRCTITAHHGKCCLKLLQNKHFLHITYKGTSHPTRTSNSWIWRCKSCFMLPLQQKTVQHFYSQCEVIYCVPEGDGTEHSAATDHALTAANDNKQYFILWSPQVCGYQHFSGKCCLQNNVPLYQNTQWHNPYLTIWMFTVILTFWHRSFTFKF